MATSPVPDLGSAARSSPIVEEDVGPDFVPATDAASDSQESIIEPDVRSCFV